MITVKTDGDAAEFVAGVAVAAAHAGITVPQVKIRRKERSNAEAKSRRLIVVGPDLLRDAPVGVQRWVAAHEVGHIVGGHPRAVRYVPYAAAALIMLVGMGLGILGWSVGALLASAGFAGALFAQRCSIRKGRRQEAEADAFANSVVSLSPEDVRFLLGDDWATWPFLRKHRPHAERLRFDHADDADLTALRQDVATVRSLIGLRRSPLVVFCDSASKAIVAKHGELQLCPGQMPSDPASRQRLLAAGLLESSHPTPSAVLLVYVGAPAALGAMALGYSHPRWALLVYAVLAMVAAGFGAVELALRNRDRHTMRRLAEVLPQRTTTSKPNMTAGA